MRVRHVSSLLFLQRFPAPISGGNGPEDSCSDGIRLRVSKNNREIPECSFFPISNLHPRGFAVSFILPETSASASSHFQGMILVSVPVPGLSPDILYRCSCIRSGGETFLRPDGPSAIQPLSHITFISFISFISLLYFFLIIYIFGKRFLIKLKESFSTGMQYYL